MGVDETTVLRATLDDDDQLTFLSGPGAVSGELRTVGVGDLRKMRAVLSDPVQYALPLGTEFVEMNPLIGQTLRLRFTGIIHCVVCGKRTKKSFAQGFCYPCFRDAPQASPCIIRPEKCEAHLGRGRDIEWETRRHLKPQIVYLSLSSALKVGVTRADQIPTRWIDQGAWKALLFAETPNRYLAGCTEVVLKAHVSDRIAWQRMLKNELASGVDLLAEKRRLTGLLPDELREFVVDDDAIVEITYPVIHYPKNVKSQTFDKRNTVKGTLEGIKGQYLIFDGGRVLNIRRHKGYEVELSAVERPAGAG